MLENTTQNDELSWPVAIESALQANMEKIGTPDASLGDFIRLIKMMREFGEEKTEPESKSTYWIDGWHEDDAPNDHST